MARMPGATWQPKAIGARALRRKGRCVVYHVAVSEAQSLMPGPDADWHFYVARDGHIYQYIDTDFQAWATRDANPTAIAVETQGGVTNTQGEPWSDAALVSLARIARWANESEGVPLRLMQSSLSTERGLGWHRLGCDPWRISGGELWSSAYGKVCPGDAKIAQMPAVLRLALNGVEDDIMATLAELRQVIREEVGNATIAPSPGGIGGDQARALQAMMGRLLDDTFAGKEHAAECRRMLGVILGWRAPATEGERSAVQKLWGGAVDVDEKAVAASLTELIRPFLLEAVRAGMAADNDAQADVIVDRLAQRLGSAT